VSESPLWSPTSERVAQTLMARFMAATGHRDYAALHRWSVEHSEDFWKEVWDFAGVRGTRGARTLVDGDRMPGAKWFPEARLNFAENLLRDRDGSDAIVFWGEERVRRRLSWNDLHDLVSRLSQALRAAGVAKAGYLPNLPEGVAAMLATASIGAIWSSCSPDFGIQGVLDRFGQIAPKVFFCADGYLYGGKEFDSTEKAKAILAGLPGAPRCVTVPYTGSGAVVGESLEVLLAPFNPVRRVASPCPTPGRERWSASHWRSCSPRSTRAPSRSSRWSSIIRSTSCTHRAPRACPNASSTGPAARCYST